MLLYRVCCQVWRILPRQSRGRLGRLWVLLTVASLVEVVGIAGWYPFVAVLMDRSAIRTSPAIAFLHDALGFQSDQSFLLFLGVAVVLLLLGCTAVRMAADWCTFRFAWGEQLRLCELLLTRYLGQPYEWFLRRNSAELVRNVLGEVPLIVEGCILNVCKVFRRFVLTAVVCGGIVVIDPSVAFVSAGVVGTMFLLVYRKVRRRLTDLGRSRLVESEQVIRKVTEALSSVKEAKVPPWQGDSVNEFRRHQARLNEVTVSQALLSSLPGHAIETLAKIGVLLIALYLVFANVRDALALIAVYIVAIIRVAPEGYDLYGDISKIRFFKPSLDNLYDLLLDDRSVHVPVTRERLALDRTIRLEGVDFGYGGPGADVLAGISLEIPRLGSLALVGETGAGKTTLADILAGVLVPRSGAVLIDDQPLDERRRPAWRNNIGYVPQQTYLTDDTVRRNIAFGVPPDRIDDRAVRAAAMAASIHDFIVGELPKGYDTVLGERGICMSGGQRQRIGIARALYRDPDVLIFDEATSALDNLTEKAVLEALERLAHKKTVIVIAHRLTSVMGCDRICFLQNGRIEGIGTFRELLEACQPFRDMVYARHRVPLVPGEVQEVGSLVTSTTAIQ